MKRKHRLARTLVLLAVAVVAGTAAARLYRAGRDLAGDVALGDAASPGTSEADAAATESGDWRLILVGPNNPIPADYRVNLTALSDGHKVDERIYPELQQMFDDAREDGIRPKISSSYRTGKQQRAELEQKTKEFINQGYSPDRALEIAKTWAAVPGTSEHQTGLAVDITSEDASAQAPDVVWRWLEKNAHRYGFIRRYPEGKSAITGISNEPWHFRYVGREAAEEIYRRGICLEEYLGTATGGAEP